MEASRPTCPRCDAAIDATALFCARCGHQLLDTATPGAIRAGRRLLRLAHHLGGLLAVIARGIARLLLAFVGALLACLIVIVIGLGPATLVVGLDIGFVLFFVVFAWSGQLVFAPRFCAHCGQPLRAAIPARETRGRLRRAASRMARAMALPTADPHARTGRGERRGRLVAGRRREPRAREHRPLVDM